MKLNYVILIGVVLTFTACTGNNDYAPKPKGYFRINYPSKAYKPFSDKAPFSFSYPQYATIIPDKAKNALPYWYNIAFPGFNGRIHLTYYSINSIKDYESMVEDARNLAFKHTVKADAIDQRLINYPDKKVYGIYYEIDGNTASSVQFFLTDSVKHYFRGALYFNERPQYDSIAPVISFIKKDIDKLIGSFNWTDHMEKKK
ncbi:MAG: gliding motility lipoprotein GldD [Flavobacterium sp.]|nr:MAG: gliding motility lipoprotein GldD [Flavobacterium sp.]